MKITVLTVCPQDFESFQKSVLTARAVERGLLELQIVDIREYAGGSFRHIDDSPYGGGAGMILRVQPVLDALRDVRGKNSHTVLFSPGGDLYTQKKAHEYAKKDHLILIAGHYEGVDARVYPYCDEQISMGDYILSGGELCAMAVTDSIVRLLGTIRARSTEEESFENGLLEYPQYSRPAEYEGMKVPEVLLGGDHEKIRRWRLKESLKRTLEKRRDLIENAELSDEEKEILEEIIREKGAD